MSTVSESVSVVQAGSFTSELRELFGDVICQRVLPAAVFLIILIAKASAVARLVQNPAALSPEVLSRIVQHAATVVFLAVVVLLFAIRKPVAGRRSSLLGAIVAVAGAFTMSIPLAAPVKYLGLLPMYLSTFLTLAGTALSLASLAALGRCFGVLPEARGLVSAGPYARVRHPLYVGEAIATLGQVVVTASIPVCSLFAVHLALQFWRSVNEEQALQEVFPDYERYRKRTWRFVPGVI